MQQCRDNGYALLQRESDGTYSYKYRLDAQGNQLALDLIDTTDLIDNFQTTATGNDNGGTLEVETLTVFSDGPIVRRNIPAALWVHMLLMVWAWGALLPWGAVLANRLRNEPGAKAGAWFRMHKKLQVVGWVLQILGFIAAVLYCQFYAAHFVSNHTIIGMTVVAIGTLQPLNALLRPHPPADGWPNGVKPLGRRIWEAVHKGLGWGAILLGVVNICLGIRLVFQMGFKLSIVVVPSAFLGLGVLPALVFLIAGATASPQPGGFWALSIFGEAEFGGPGRKAGPLASVGEPLAPEGSVKVDPV